jgi:hypothetical protein
MVRYSETSVNIYQSTQRYISEDLNLQQHRCKNHKSLIFMSLLTSRFRNLKNVDSVYVQQIFSSSSQDRQLESNESTASAMDDKRRTSGQLPCNDELYTHHILR